MSGWVHSAGQHGHLSWMYSGQDCEKVYLQSCWNNRFQARVQQGGRGPRVSSRLQPGNINTIRQQPHSQRHLTRHTTYSVLTGARLLRPVHKFLRPLGVLSPFRFWGMSLVNDMRLHGSGLPGLSLQRLNEVILLRQSEHTFLKRQLKNLRSHHSFLYTEPSHQPRAMWAG